MLAQFSLGLLSGMVVGAAIFPHPLSRAIAIALSAGAIITGIATEGIEGYYAKWATYLPAQMGKFAWFWAASLPGSLASLEFGRDHQNESAHLTAA